MQSLLLLLFTWQILFFNGGEVHTLAYDVSDKLVIAVASSALFDLKESDKVFRENGESAYRSYQRENERKVLKPSVVFPLVKRLLSLNDAKTQPIEVVLFSRNDPDTGLRVFHSIHHYGLDISRAVFCTGKNPYHYMQAFHAALFLSGNPEDVKEAMEQGFPAGYVSDTGYEDDEEDTQLRLAFDFDAVLADDSAEAIYRAKGLDEYQAHEAEYGDTPLGKGPLYHFLERISMIQHTELARKDENPSYEPKIRIAICTARNAPAHERVVTTLREWDIRIDEAFFLGGMNKAAVLAAYRPHIFFDDQVGHIEKVRKQYPSVHVPYGIAND